jgi:hypothetical protein
MVTTHPWNDLEQQFLQFTTTVRELAEAIGKVVEDGRVPADVSDRVSNLAIGLSSYTLTCEDEIATAMEAKIRHDYRTGALQQTTGILTIEEDYTIQLPTYVTDLLGWVPGDTLQWEMNGDNAAIVRKLAK